MNWYLAVLKKYADFSGRARRKEYWMFVLFNAIIAVVLNILTQVTLSNSQDPRAIFANPFYLLSLVYSLAVLIPSLAVAVRRLHDTNRTGWTIFLELIPLVGAIIVLVYLCQDSTPGENKYGANPKEETYSQTV